MTSVKGLFKNLANPVLTSKMHFVLNKTPRDSNGRTQPTPRTSRVVKKSNFAPSPTTERPIYSSGFFGKHRKAKSKSKSTLELSTLPKLPELTKRVETPHTPTKIGGARTLRVVTLKPETLSELWHQVLKPHHAFEYLHLLKVDLIMLHFLPPLYRFPLFGDPGCVRFLFKSSWIDDSSPPLESWVLLACTAVLWPALD